MDENDKKDPFEYVPFVNKLTHHQLKLLVRKLWLNFHILGNYLEDKRSDITITIDHILDGNKPKLDSITDSKRFVQIDDKIIEYDTNTDSFRYIKDGKMSEPTPAMDYEKFVKDKYQS